MLFAAKGFQRTIIREIATYANCNIAAVNYYFHGKNQLYKEVFKSQIQKMIRLMNSTPQKKDKNHYNALENDLQHAVAILISFHTDHEDPTFFADLFYQEMVDPHLPKDFFIQELVYPITKYFRSIFRRNLISLSNDNLDLCVFSLVGQLLHLINLHHAFNMPNQPESVIFNRDRTIQHIVEFSAAGAIHLSVKDRYKYMIDQINEL